MRPPQRPKTSALLGVRPVRSTTGNEASAASECQLILISVTSLMCGPLVRFLVSTSVTRHDGPPPPYPYQGKQTRPDLILSRRKRCAPLLLCHPRKLSRSVDTRTLKAEYLRTRVWFLNGKGHPGTTGKVLGCPTNTMKGEPRRRRVEGAAPRFEASRTPKTKISSVYFHRLWRGVCGT